MFQPQQPYPPQPPFSQQGQPPPLLDRPPSHPQQWGGGKGPNVAAPNKNFQSDQAKSSESNISHTEDSSDKLPSSIEKVLAYKAEVSKDVNWDRQPETEGETPGLTDSAVEFENVEESDEEETTVTKEALAQKLKNQKKKLKKKKAKGKKKELKETSVPEPSVSESENNIKTKSGDEGVEIEYVPESIDIPLNVFDPNYQHFIKVFDQFKVLYYKYVLFFYFLIVL